MEGKPKFILASHKEISALLLLQGQVLQPVLPEQHLPNKLPTPINYPHYQKNYTQTSTPTPSLGKLHQGIYSAFLPADHIGFVFLDSCCSPMENHKSIQEKHRFHTAGATVRREVITLCQKLHIAHYSGYTTQFKYQKHCKPHQHGAPLRPVQEASQKSRGGASSGIYAQDSAIRGRCALSVL